MANEVRKSIINLIEKHRYYSVIIDCTPDISHQEQVLLVFRIVNMHWDKLTEPSIQESFMDFVNIHSKSGLSLSNLLILMLAEYEIPLSDFRGQGYDNGTTWLENIKECNHVFELQIKKHFLPHVLLTS